jgi:hypothetical protein
MGCDVILLARSGALSHAFPAPLASPPRRLTRMRGLGLAAQSHFRSCCVAGARRVHDGARACAGRRRLAQVQFVVVFSSISLKKYCPPPLNCAFMVPPLCAPPKNAIMPVMPPPPHYAKIYASVRRSAQVPRTLPGLGVLGCTGAHQASPSPHERLPQHGRHANLSVIATPVVLLLIIPVTVLPIHRHTPNH